MKRAIETGAMALPSTRDAIARYARRLVIRAVGIVLAINVLNSVMLRVTLPWVLQLVVGLSILVLIVAMLVCLLSYTRLAIIRTVLRREDWVTISGCARTIYAGPLPTAHVAVIDFGGEELQAVDYVGPLRFARGLPSELLPANMLAVRWRGLRVYSAFDGSTPALGLRVRPKFVRNAFANVVEYG